MPFSGHGLTQGGINYLLPADTRVNIPTETAIPLSKVYAAIQNARQQIIFLDACHSGQRRDKGTTSGAMSFAFAEAVFSEAEGRVTWHHVILTNPVLRMISWDMAFLHIIYLRHSVEKQTRSPISG